MIGQLYNYFGVVGLASIAAWGLAILLLVAFVRYRRRNLVYLLAVALAVAGWVLADVNSAAVSAIQVDRTEELQSARLRQEQARRLELAKSGPRFAEDAAAGDPGDTPGTGAAKPQAAAEEPAYRRMGKQQRDAGKGEPAVVTAEDGGNKDSSAEAAGPKPRMMKDADVERANLDDRYNLFAAHCTLVLAILLVIWDYLARFNRTSESYLPLPIGGRWLDALSRKRYSVFVPSSTDGSCKNLLERFVRRGETFIYFGPNDPWPAGALPRLSVTGKTIRSLPRMIYDGTTGDSEFAFEAAWFDRYGVVVTDPAIAARMLHDLEPYLSIRHLTKAAARQTVNLVWNFPSPPPELLMPELMALGREANFRIIICGRDASPPRAALRFEEVLA